MQENKDKLTNLTKPKSVGKWDPKWHNIITALKNLYKSVTILQYITLHFNSCHFGLSHQTLQALRMKLGLPVLILALVGFAHCNPMIKWIKSPGIKKLDKTIQNAIYHKCLKDERSIVCGFTSFCLLDLMCGDGQYCDIVTQ